LPVDQHPDVGRVAGLIKSVSTRADKDQLTSAMLRHCWPGGVGDRTNAVALEWVSRWRPQRVKSPQFECRCGTGCCGVCN
jgi:hypothetical protein